MSAAANAAQRRAIEAAEEAGAQRLDIAKRLLAAFVADPNVDSFGGAVTTSLNVADMLLRRNAERTDEAIASARNADYHGY
jgi:hypothetical protein